MMLDKGVDHGAHAMTPVREQQRASFGIHFTDCLEQAVHPITIELGRYRRMPPARVDTGLCWSIVRLVSELPAASEIAALMPRRKTMRCFWKSVSANIGALSGWLARKIS